MKFEWKRNFHDDDHYWTGIVYDDNEKEINSISLTDCTCGYPLEDALKYNNGEAHKFVIHWCRGWSMSEWLDDSEYTLETAKKWCEKWILSKYIRGYIQTLAELDNMRKRAEWCEQFLNDRGIKYEEEEQI